MPIIFQSLKGGRSVDCGDLLVQKKRSIMLAIQATKPVKGGQTQITRTQMTGYDSGLFAKGLDLYLVNNTPPPCTPVVINITDIATLDPVQGWYVLNADYTITECQILDIQSGQFRISEGHTLTNRGTIIIANLNSSIQCSNELGNGPEGGIINNIGSMRISDGAYIICRNNNYDNGEKGGTIINSGSIVIENNCFISLSNNAEDRYPPLPPLLPNVGLAGGTIKNTGTILIEIGGEIENMNDTNDSRTKGGIIYIYGGGKIENYGTIRNESFGSGLGGTISRTDESSGCGVGTLDPVGTILFGIFDNVCPP